MPDSTDPCDEARAAYYTWREITYAEMCQRIRLAIQDHREQELADAKQARWGDGASW